MTVKLNLLSKKYNYNVSVKNERFGSDREKQDRKSKIFPNKILESLTVYIEDPGGIIHIDNQPLGLKALTFLYNTQKSTKKIDIQKYSRALLALQLPPHLVSNTYAKHILEASESEKDIF